MRLLLAGVLAGVLLMTSVAEAGWGRGSCAGVSCASGSCGGSEAAVLAPAFQAAPAAVDFWTFHQGVFYHWHNGRQVGAYQPSNDTFQSYDEGTRTWGKNQNPGWGYAVAHKADEPKPEREAVTQNFGLDMSKLGGAGERISINGRPVSKAEAVRIVGAPNLPDDSGRLRLTIIGTDAERQPVLADLASNVAFAPFKDSLLVQDYDPSKPHEAWALRPGFQTNGHPTIYLESPNGTVILRQDAYDAPSLASAVRKAQPNYDPTKDPNGKTPPIPGLPDVPPVVWAGAALGAAAVVRKAMVRK